MKDLREYAMEHRENGEAERLIKTIHSDELYPWPKGTYLSKLSLLCMGVFGCIFSPFRIYLGG